MNTIKKFIHYYGPYKAVFFIDLICAAVISLVDLAYPQILRTMTKTLFTQDKDIILHALPVIAASLFVMYIVQSLCKYYVTYQGHMMGAKMERDMRRELFDHYQELSFSYYSRNNSGQMMSKLVSDLFDISEFAHHGPENLFISLVKIVGAFIFLFFINKKLALPLILLVIVMFVFSFRQNAKMQETFMENRRKIGDVNASLQDTLSGIRVVQSFANEDIERAKFKKSNEAFLVSKRDNYHCMGSFMSSNLFFQGMMYLVTLVYGGYLIAQGRMDVVDLSMYALYIGIFISPIQILVELMEMMQKGLSGFRRYLDVMGTEIEIQDKPDAKPLTDIKGTVTYEDVSFHYPGTERDILRHIDLTIHPGEKLAVVGLNGAGKTTMVMLLCGFYDPTEGRVLLNGQDIREFDRSAYYRLFSAVFQGFSILDTTIAECVAQTTEHIDRVKVDHCLAQAGLTEAIAKFPQGVDTHFGREVYLDGVQLSGGQTQRLMLARALYKDGPILVLDEPTAALDPIAENDIYQKYSDMTAGKTSVFISHRLASTRFCDRILFIADGGIAEEGTHKELLAKGGAYAELFAVQSRYYQEGGVQDEEES